jgi:hypothetical protein
MVEVAVVLKSLIDVADRFRTWADYRNLKANQRFTQLLEPTFNELTVIHNDYLIMFNKVLSMFPAAEEETRLTRKEVNQAIEAGNWLAEDRLTFVSLREKTRIVATEAAQASLPKEEDDLVAAMADYFSELSLFSGNSTPSNALKGNLEGFVKEAKSRDADQELLVRLARRIRWSIDHILSEQEKHWKNVLTRFARLKVAAAKR